MGWSRDLKAKLPAWDGTAFRMAQRLGCVGWLGWSAGWVVAAPSAYLYSGSRRDRSKERFRRRRINTPGLALEDTTDCSVAGVDSQEILFCCGFIGREIDMVLL